MDMASACLVGVRCRYNGKDKTVPEIRELFIRGALAPFCPEMLGGFGVPRAGMRVEGGNGYDVLRGDATVVNENGGDAGRLTAAIIKGAEKSGAIAAGIKPEKIYLKSKSVSCGLGENGVTGVTAAFLQSEGYHLVEVK
jgi:uncharacterized protein YbbK (DUF523 family)